MKFTIKNKILLNNLIVIFVMIGFIVLSIVMFNKLVDDANKIRNLSNKRYFLLRGEKDHINWVLELSHAILLKKHFDGQLNHTLCNFGKWYYKQNIDNVAEKKIYKAIESPHIALHAAGKKINTLIKAQKFKEALVFFRNTEATHLAKIGKLLKKYRDLVNDKTTLILSESKATQKTVITFFIIAGIIIPIISGIFSFLIISSISKPLAKVTNMLKDITEGDGDLTKRLDVKTINCSAVMNCGKRSCPDYGVEAHCWFEVGSWSADIHCPKILSGEYEDCSVCEVYKMAIKNELDEISTWFNSFVEKIEDIVIEVKDAAVNLAASTEEISASSQNLSASAQGQAASVEETSASMEEFNSSVVQVVNNIDDVNKQSDVLYSTAQNSAELIDNAIKSMNKINESSQIISEILDVINDIADQTNLLALNAAIEAARAGEYGRGFAVVADEISKLADKSSENSKKIEKLITQSINDIQKGTVIVEKSGEAFTDIIQGIGRSSELVSQITSAVEQQKMGSEQIQGAIMEINDGAQNASASAEEMSATSEEVQNMAERLNELVNRFKVNDRGGLNNYKGVTEYTEKKTVNKRKQQVPSKVNQTNKNINSTQEKFQNAQNMFTKAKDDLQQANEKANRQIGNSTNNYIETPDN